MEEEADDVHANVNSTSANKSKAPVKFYIDDHDDHEEKENLIKAPEIVIDPPSDHSRTPDRELMGNNSRC